MGIALRRSGLYFDVVEKDHDALSPISAFQKTTSNSSLIYGDMDISHPLMPLIGTYTFVDLILRTDTAVGVLTRHYLVLCRNPNYFACPVFSGYRNSSSAIYKLTAATTQNVVALVLQMLNC